MDHRVEPLDAEKRLGAQPADPERTLRHQLGEGRDAVVGATWSRETTLLTISDEGSWDCPIRIGGPTIGIDAGLTVSPSEWLTIDVWLDEGPVLGEQLFGSYTSTFGFQVAGGVGVGLWAATNDHGVRFVIASLTAGLGGGMETGVMSITSRGDCTFTPPYQEPEDTDSDTG